MLNEGEMLMKKSLIALAVAGAMTAPMVAQADATLYGSFRAGLAFQDNEDADLRDESSRIGIKGDVDLGLENTKGIYHWEAKIDLTDNGGDVTGSENGNFDSRLAYMGATGNWGTVLVGRQYHPHYNMVVSHTNIFNSTDREFGEAYVLGNQFHKREDNTLAYASPIMGGFQVVGGIVVASKGNSDDSGTYDEDVDGYNIGAQFTGVEGLRVSLSYGDVDTNVGNTDVESELVGAGVTYTIADFTVAARYEDREDKFGGQTVLEADEWELAAKYQIGATALKARYGNLDVQNELTAFDDEGDQWGVEVEQKLGKRGRVYVAYTDFDTEGAEAASQVHSFYRSSDVITAENTAVIGYRLDF
jgi:predicted porin